MRSTIDSTKLNNFIKKAGSECYLGGMKRSPNCERPGFYEMEYSEGELSYRDSFTGYYMTAGQEIVRQNGIPIWSSNYGGGVKEKRLQDQPFFKELEAFLIESLAEESDPSSFSPRGPKAYEKGDWKYQCKWKGSIEEFNGLEKIFFKDDEVFYHRFFGGLIVGKDN